jgi:hypothetical protein
MQAFIDMIQQHAEAKRQVMLADVARKFNASINGNSLELPDGSMEREYKQGAFISQTLSEANIKPK